MMFSSIAGSSSFFISSAIVLFTSLLALILSRIYFSPLANIPGPKLAAASTLYEFYFDCILSGKYIFEIERLHKVYGTLPFAFKPAKSFDLTNPGTIVRIGPKEVHIDDPYFFDKLYNSSTKLSKDAWFYRFLSRSSSAFLTIDPNVHRLRRSPLNRFFSTASISKLSPLLAERVGKFCERLEEVRGKGTPVPLSDAYRCLATDIISDYTVLEANSLLEYEDFGREHAVFLRVFSYLAIWNRHLPFILPLFELIPRWIVASMGSGPGLALYDGAIEQKRQVSLVIANEGKVSSNKEYPVIMNEIFKADLPPEEKTPVRLFHEVGILIGAGTETTGATLESITYNILKSEERVKNLKDELASVRLQVADGLIDLKQAESLPYLNACVQEGLRFANSVAGRMPRINYTEATRYGEYVLRPGTKISMSIRDVHRSSKVFKDPNVFDETRWLGEDTQKLERYLVPFGRGSRNCVGQNLAMAELRMIIANVFKRFDLELFNTTDRDVEMSHDFFAPFVPVDSAGLQVLVK